MTDKTKDTSKDADNQRTPEGPERVLLFADSLKERDEKQAPEEVQELEDWLTCRIGKQVFALPIRHTQEVLRVERITRVPHAPYPVRGVTNLRGSVLPVVDLRLRLGLEAVEIGDDHRIIVVSSHDRLIGLLVDKVDQVAEIDRLKIEAAPEDVLTERSYYILGVFHRGDDLLILLDTDRVLQVRDVDDRAEDA